MKIKLPTSKRLTVLFVLLSLFSLNAVSGQNVNATWGANGNTSWYTGSNWAGGIYPGLQGGAASNTNIATFTSAYTATTVGINMTTASLNLGAVSVDNTRTIALNIGNSGGTNGSFRLYGATVNSVANTILRNNSSGLFTLQAAQNGNMGLVLSNATNNIINTDGTGGIAISSVISGGASNALTKTGTGLLTLSGTNTFTGVTTIDGGVLSVGTIGNGGVAGNLGQASNAATNLVLGNGTLRYTGATASTNRAYTISNGATASMDVTTNTLTISGAAASSTGALEKVGSGTLILSGTNANTGGTIITAGTLTLGSTTTLADSGLIILNGGTLRTGATTGFSETVGTLDLQASSVIELGTGSHTLTFAASNGVSWAGSTMITITGWTGGYDGTASATAGRIFVGSTVNGLTADQVKQIQFTHPTSGVNIPAKILSSGEIVPAGNAFYAIANAAWNVNTTWSFTSGGAAVGAGIYPGSGSGADVVFIGESATNRTVSIPTGFAASCASLSLGTNGDNTQGVLNFSAASSSLTVSGDVIMNRPNGTATSSIGLGAGSLTVNGNLEMAHHTASAGNSNRVNSITVSTGTLTVTGDLIFSGEDALQNQIVFSGSGTLNIAGNFTITNSLGTLTPNTSTVNFNGTAAQTIPIGVSAVTYNNLTVNNTHASGATLGAAVSATNVTGAISVGNVSSGSLLNTNNLAVTFGNSKTLTVASGSTLNSGTSLITFGTGGTATINGTFINSNSTGALLFGTTGNANINGIFQTANTTGFSGAATTAVRSTNTPTITLGSSSTIDYNAAGNQTVTIRTYANLTLSNSGNKTVGNLTVINNNLAISGTAKALLTNGGASTALSLSLGGVNQITGSWGSTASAASNTNNTWFVAANTGIINVNVGCTTGTWLGTSSTDWNTAANWCGGIPTAATNVVIPSGTLFQPTIASGTTAVCNNITINGSATLTLANSATSLLNISGNFTNNGALSQGASSIVSFIGSSNQSLIGSATTTFSNLTLNTTTSAITVTNTAASKAFIVTGNLTVTQGNLVLQATDADYLIGGDLIVAATTGTLTHSVSWNVAGKLLKVSGNIAIDGLFTYTIRSHVQMDGLNKSVRTGSNPLSAFSILTLANTGGTITAGGTLKVDDNFWVGFGVGAVGGFATAGQTVTALSALLNANGFVTINGGVLNVTGGLAVGYATGTGNGSVTFSSGTLNADSVTIGASPFTGTFAQTGGTANISGNLTIATSSSMTITNSPAINVGGNWTNNGTYTKATETVTLNGTTQSIGGSNSTNFNNLALTNGGTKTFNTSTVVGANLSIATGVVANLSTILTHTANSLTLGGSGTPSGTWGSTTSAAAHKNNTYFAATTGIVTVGAISCPAISATINGTTATCGGTTNLTVTITGGVSPYTVVYAGGGGGTITSYVSGNNIPVSPSSTTTYTLTSVTDALGCTAGTLTGSAIITVNTSSTAPTGATGTTTICNGGSTTLTVSGGSAGTGAVAEWFTGSCGGASAGTGPSITVSPSSTTTYYVRYNGTCNTTTCGTVTVTVNTLSTAPTGATGTTTICNGGSTTLTVSGGSAGTGAIAEWFTGSCGGASAGTGPSITVSPSSTTTYYVRYNGTCNTTTCGTVTVTVNTLSTAPTGATGTTTICNGDSTTLTVAGGSAGTGATAEWFTGSCGGASAGTGNSISVSPSSTTTYYVRYNGTCNTTTCATVTVTVNTLSTAPTGATGTTTICNGDSTTLTVAGGTAGTGATAEWFTGSCGGTSAGTGNSISVSPSSTTTYYVRYNGTCNTTTCGTVTVTVNTLSTAPTGATGTTTICNGDSTTLTVAGGSLGTGAIVEWFTGSCGGVAAGTGPSITVSPSSTETYYVRYNGTCNTTTCATVIVTVNTQSVAPTGATGTTTICNGDSTTLTVAGGSLGTGAIVEWFTGSCGGVAAGTGPSITVSPSSTETYYVRYNGTCNTTTCATVTVTVNTQSVAPTGATGTTTICNGDSTTLTVAGGSLGTGAIVEWFTGSCGGVAAGTGPSITVSPSSTETYYVRYNGTCNTTTCATVTVTVNTLSTAPTGATGTTTICNGDSTTLTVAGGSAGTGAVAEWFTGSCGGASAGTGNSITVSPSSTTTYYVRYNGTCNTTTCGTVTVTVNTLSTAPTGATGTTTICNGDSTTLTVAGGSLGTGAIVEWFTGSCGGVAAGTGPSITVSPSSTETYYVRYNGTCNTTTCATVTVTVNTQSVAPTGATGTTTICNGDSTTLTVAGGSLGTGAIVEWFTGSCGGVSAGTGPSITVSPSSTETYYVRYNGTCNTTTCATVTVTVNTQSVAPTGATGTTVICNGGSTTLTVAGGTAGTGAIAEWFTGSCGGVSAGTGPSITVSPSSTETYYVRYNGTCNTTTCATVTVTVNTQSVAPTGATGTTVICNGGSTTLTVAGGTAGTGATAEWFTGSCGGTSAGTGNSISVSPSSTTTYYVRYNGTCNTTTCGTVTVTVNTLSTAPTGATGTTTICNGDSTTLTVAGGSLGTGAIVEWFTGSCGGVAAGTGPSITVSPSSTETYYVRYNGTCNTTTCATVTVTVNTQSVAPTGATGTTTICNGDSTTLTVAGGSLGTGAIVEWFTGSCGGVSAGTGPSITVSPSSTETYYVRYNGTCNTTTCATVTVTVNTQSVAPTGATGTTVICNGGSTTLTVAGGTAGTGAIAEWFTGSCGGVAAGTGNSITVSPSSTTTYYVRYNGACNTTTCATVTVNVSAQPTAGTLTPTPATGVVCGGTIVSATATAGSGGAGTVVDELEISLSGGAYTAYVSGTPINTAGETSVSIRTRRTADGTGCNASAYNTVTWTLDSTTWNGTAWSNGTPTSTKSVIFTGNYTIGADMNACSVTVTNNAVVSVTTGFDVTLYGAITVSSGSFTVNNAANLIQTTNAANSGNIIVKRNTNPLIRLDYTLWSSPVANQQLLAFSPLTSISPTIRFYTYNTSTNLYNSVASPSTTDFATGIGYLIRLPFNHPTAPAIWPGSFTGVPNNGTYNVSLTNIAVGQRFNAIGNPYPSTVNISQFASDNSANIEPTLYYWRKTNNTASPSYCSWNTTSNTFSDNGEAYTDSPLGILQTGQGFIVEAKPGATSVQFNNNQRTGDNANQFFRTNSNATTATPPAEAHRIWLNLTGAASEFSQTVVGYFTNATQGADDYDSKYFNDGQLTLNSIIGSNRYVIQGRAVPFQTSDVVPLNYSATNAGNYTFAIDHVDGLFTGGAQNIFIKDNLNGTYNNLNTAPYTFATAAGSFANRFELVYETALANQEHIFTDSDVIVYHQNNDLVVNSSNIIMKAIKVFDIRGRLLVEKTNINASEARLNVGSTNQVLILQITSTEGEVVIKKVVN